MSPELLRKDLSARIQSLLETACEQAQFADLGKNPAEARDRLLDIEVKDYGYLAYIASDQFSLETKAALETYLIDSLRDFAQVRIYYKRRQGLGSRVQNSPDAVQPSQVGPRPAAFGAQLKRKAISGVAKIVAVSSGKGGVGKSTVSANLAVALALQGHRVGLLDTDLYGPSAPMLLGLEGVMPVTADQKMIPLEKYGVKVVSFGFMSDPHNPVIWRGPMVAKALGQLFYQTAWGELDYLILDLPPGTGDVQLTIIESLPLEFALIVSTPQSVALLDAHKGLSMFEKLRIPVLGLVENMSHFQCSACGHFEDVFGHEHIDEFARQRQVETLARIPLSRVIREASDQGVPVVLHDPFYAQHYLELAERVHQGLLSKNLSADQS